MGIRLRFPENILPPSDRLVTGAVGALIIVTPLAIGTVNRGAFVTMELAIFTLALIRVANPAAGGITIFENPLSMREAGPLLLSLGLMALLFLLQLIPMPPQLLRVLSPGAYQIYQVAFPGWPYGNE